MEIEKARRAEGLIRRINDLEQLKNDLVKYFKTSDLQTEEEVIKFFMFLRDKNLYYEVFRKTMNDLCNYIDSEIVTYKKAIDEL